jgi:hypothetical protein
MPEVRFDKIWIIREAVKASDGKQSLTVENTENGKSWKTMLPRGGDWDRCQFIKLFRQAVDEDCGISHVSEISKLAFRVHQHHGESHSRLILVMGTKEGDDEPVAVMVFRNIELEAGGHVLLQVGENPTLVDRIDVIAETASIGHWLGTEGSYPNSFSFVVASKETGLLVSECFPEGPYQVMEAGVCGRFEFRLPFPTDVAFLREKCTFTIKAKSTNGWMPRHIIALGVSGGLSVLLGGSLNLDHCWMGTGSGQLSSLVLKNWK